MKNVHAIIIDSRDNVATLCETGHQGDVITNNDQTIELLQDFNLGDKVALNKIDVGDPIIKYNAVMGRCTQAIQAGEWVHGHNLASNFMDSNGTDDHE